MADTPIFRARSPRSPGTIPAEFFGLSGLASALSGFAQQRKADQQREEEEQRLEEERARRRAIEAFQTAQTVGASRESLLDIAQETGLLEGEVNLEFDPAEYQQRKFGELMQMSPEERQARLEDDPFLRRTFNQTFFGTLTPGVQEQLAGINLEQAGLSLQLSEEQLETTDQEQQLNTLRIAAEEQNQESTRELNEAANALLEGTPYENLGMGGVRLLQTQGELDLQEARGRLTDAQIRRIESQISLDEARANALGGQGPAAELVAEQAARLSEFLAPGLVAPEAIFQYVQDPSQLQEGTRGILDAAANRLDQQVQAEVDKAVNDARASDETPILDSLDSLRQAGLLDTMDDDDIKRLMVRGLNEALPGSAEFVPDPGFFGSSAVRFNGAVLSDPREAIPISETDRGESPEDITRSERIQGTIDSLLDAGLDPQELLEGARADLEVAETEEDRQDLRAFIAALEGSGGETTETATTEPEEEEAEVQEPEEGSELELTNLTNAELEERMDRLAQDAQNTNNPQVRNRLRREMNGVFRVLESRRGTAEGAGLEGLSSEQLRERFDSLTRQKRNAGPIESRRLNRRMNETFLELQRRRQ